MHASATTRCSSCGLSFGLAPGRGRSLRAAFNPSSQYLRRTRPTVDVELPVAVAIDSRSQPSCESNKTRARTRTRELSSPPRRSCSSSRRSRALNRTVRSLGLRCLLIQVLEHNRALMKTLDHIYPARGLVPHHRGLDRLVRAHRSRGMSSGETSSSMLRAVRGVRRMSPRVSSCLTIRWTDGGVTSKKRCMSASAGGRLWIFV